ncbi:hypothetical protein Naga_101058g1 [Nannochloropsis gaditana]|uniref:Uncharacterized protein n=1 Tax=Nannochloropsis gaditana TaxID=72520 RepID=W7T126_9STRA|nr:hypothetical protein Naga_101058g1 [Nannochloropsis gaditana]
MPYTSMHHRHIRALSCREKAWATPGSGMIRRAMGSNRRGRSGRPPLLSLVLLLLLFTILPFVEGGIYGFWKWFRGNVEGEGREGGRRGRRGHRYILSSSKRPVVNLIHCLRHTKILHMHVCPWPLFYPSLPPSLPPSLLVFLVPGHYKEVVSKVSSEQYAEFDHVLIDVNQVD